MMRKAWWTAVMLGAMSAGATAEASPPPLGLYAVTQSSSVAVPAAPGSGPVLTGTTAWNSPPAPAPTPTPLPPLGGSTTQGVGADIAFRMQAGLTGGVLIKSGASVALTAAAIWQSFRVELGGRYHAPRVGKFPSAFGFAARLSIFELDLRGCGSVIRAGRLTVPLCGGLGAGRWSADPTFNTPADPLAKLWVGAHLLMAARYEVDTHVALWAGAEGNVGLVRPELRLDEDFYPGAAPLRARRYGTAIELGVEVKLD